MYKEKQKNRQKSLIKNTPELIDFDSLLARWKIYNKTAADILRLGQSSNFRFFVTVRYVSIIFGVLHEDPSGDPIGFSPTVLHEIGGKEVPYQVSGESITAMLNSRDTPKRVDYIQLICPNHPDCNTRIETNSDFGLGIREILNVNEQTHLATQRGRTVNDLWIATEDIEVYEEEYLSKEMHPILSQEDLTNAIETAVSGVLAPVVSSSAKTGKKFMSGRKKGANCPFTDLMLNVYNNNLNGKKIITTKELWDLIPEGLDELTGIVVQEKDDNLEDQPVIFWLHPKGKETVLTFNNFKNRLAKVKKLAKKIQD